MDDSNNTQGLTGHNSDPSLEDLGNDEISVQKWLRTRFQEKEDLLSQFYNIHNQCPPPPITTTNSTTTTTTTTNSTIPIGTCNSTTVLLPIATPIHNNNISGTSSSACAYTNDSNTATSNTHTTSTTNNMSNKDQSSTNTSNTNSIIQWPKLLTTNNTIDIYAIIIMSICIIYITISLLLSSIFRWIYTCIFVIYACFRLVDGFDRLELFLHCDMLVSEGLGQTGIGQNYDHLRNNNSNNERWNNYRVLTQSRTGQRS